MRRNVFISLLILFLVSCEAGKTNLEYALNLAGKNRSELEKVLEYYRKETSDSLKLKAAIFLIENMPGHYSYKDNYYLAGFYREISESINPQQSESENVSNYVDISKKYLDTEILETVPDLEIIASEYLINNIERAFDVWQNGEWATHVNFNNFCEYILPYKVKELQTLDNWREYAGDMFTGDLQYLHHCDLYRNSAFRACTSVNREIERNHTQEFPFDESIIQIRNVKTMAIMPLGTCSDYCFLKLAVMRSKGIPVMEDITPQWPFRSGGHAWNIVLNNSGKDEVFAGLDSDPGMHHKPDEKKAKVFRNIYAINKDLKVIQDLEKEVPRFFRNYHMKDVTRDYMGTANVEVKIPDNLKNVFAYAYLAVFDNRSWVPVHWGKVEGGKVTFTDMGKNIMYLPVYYAENKIIPFSHPLLLTTHGDTVIYEADTINTQTMEIQRKYFTGKHCYDVASRLLGGEFHAANKPDFSDSELIHRFDDYVVKAGDFKLKSIGKYRYWRYYSAEDKYNNMAELYFFHSGQDRPIYGDIIGTEGTYANPLRNTKKAVFDNDPLTYYDALNPSDSWVGMDFREPVSIDRIAYVPRGDGNDVYPGNRYELLYWATNKWHSLGERESSDIRLVFQDVPSNTIYWLRNLTAGKDERIFTYKDQEQIWDQS